MMPDLFYIKNIVNTIPSMETSHKILILWEIEFKLLFLGKIQYKSQFSTKSSLVLILASSNRRGVNHSELKNNANFIFNRRGKSSENIENENS
jgi:hypothetical protein